MPVLCSDHTASLPLLKPSKLSALTFPWPGSLPCRASHPSLWVPGPGLCCSLLPRPSPELASWPTPHQRPCPCGLGCSPAFPLPGVVRKESIPTSYTSQVTEQQGQPRPSGQCSSHTCACMSVFLFSLFSFSFPSANKGLSHSPLCSQHLKHL